jgi:hypothetical protein
MSQKTAKLTAALVAPTIPNFKNFRINGKRFNQFLKRFTMAIFIPQKLL